MTHILYLEVKLDILFIDHDKYTSSKNQPFVGLQNYVKIIRKDYIHASAITLVSILAVRVQN